MTRLTRPISDLLAPVVLGLCALLAAANWTLVPPRSAAWWPVGLALGGMALALFFSRGPAPEDSPRENSRRSIRVGVLFGALMMACALGVKLTHALGARYDSSLTTRIVMILLGAFYVFMGNELPKRLSPLWASRCDPVREQAFRRFAGWTWVLAGLAFIAAWLVLPLDLAEVATMVLVVGTAVVVTAKGIQLRRTRQPEA